MERYKALLEEICTLVWHSNDAGAFTEPQPAWMAFTGQTEQEAGELGWLQAIHPDDINLVAADLQTAIENNTVFRTQGRVFHAESKEYRLLDATAHPIYDRDGNLIEWCGGAIDIHEKAKYLKRLEAKTRRQERNIAQKDQEINIQNQLLDTLVANSSLLIYMFDKQMNYSYVNSLGAEILGCEPDEIIGRHWRDLNLPEDTMTDIEEQCAKVLQTNQPIQYKVWFPSLGRMRLFAYTLAPALDNQGNAISVICASEDITERDAAEQAVRASESRMRLLTDALPIMVAYVDQDHRYVYNNPQYEKAFNKPLSEITGKKLIEVIGEDAYNAGLPKITAALNGERQDYEISFTDPNDSYHFMQVTYIPHIEKEQVLGFFASIVDLSELKNAQMNVLEQERLLAHLHRVSSLGEMASNIAHELNQPLTAIASYASVARRLLDLKSLNLPNGDDIARSLDGVEKQSHRASDIVRKIRAFVRKREIESVNLDLNDVTAEAIEFASVTMSDADSNITFEATQDSTAIMGDRTQLQQVIINLIVNANDAMKNENQHKIQIKTKRLKDNTVKLSVRDYGPAISQESLERIFEPFFSTKDDGMGMGLAVCHSIAEAHAGRLEAIANEDAGVTMTLTIPGI